MTELTKAMSRTGALDEGMVREFSKWKLPIDLSEAEPFESPEEAIEAIETALTGKNQVEVRATDLDILRQYLRTQRRGKIHLVQDEDDEGTFPISFGVTQFGEYIIPWRSDSMKEVLTNGESHIIDGRRKVYISDVRDMYFGERKIFIVCVPERKTNGHKS